MRLELAIPAERVLLSNEGAWWCVINPHRLWLDEQEAELPNFESEEAEKAALDEGWSCAMQWPLAEHWQFRIVPSWERVFDLETTAGEWGDDVQATFERLELADVVSVTEFVAREIRWEL